ncbi:hypothetical protein C4D60_Mb02t07220 [Musa balbisiana]|uniref:Uncharacterized protein n=1 Tax=Musa balbisiana TaxID=52838 RepID=A0A4S8I8W1_MUSBA|nr:hypothetical protein C4D60_Mb02t07220 [Musa balbisiana]
MAGRRKNKSICERSAMMAVQLVRMSSLVFAKMPFGRGRGGALMPPGRGEVAALPAQPEHVVEIVQVDAERHAGRRCVDASASEFIRKFHAKNRGDPSGASPPPSHMPNPKRAGV